MPTVSRERPNAPLFREFTIPQLCGLIPYSESYLEELASGRQPIRPRFRRTVSRLLGKSESELFGPDDGHVSGVGNQPEPTNKREDDQAPTHEGAVSGGC